jgi:hypothetical protein
MSTFTLLSASPVPERHGYLSPPPRPVTLNERARWLRTGFLAALLLGPNCLLWMGYNSGENLRTLAAHGKSSTGHITLRG